MRWRWLAGTAIAAATAAPALPALAGPVEVSDDLAKEAEWAERDLCERYDRKRLKLLIANGGWAEPK